MADRSKRNGPPFLYVFLTGRNRQVHLELIVGDRDALLIKGELDFLDQIVPQIPVIAVLAPDAQKEHDRRRAVFVHHDAGGRILQNQGMLLGEFLQQRFGGQKIVFVADGKQ